MPLLLSVLDLSVLVGCAVWMSLAVVVVVDGDAAKQVVFRRPFLLYLVHWSLRQRRLTGGGAVATF